MAPPIRHARVIVLRHGPAESRDPSRWPDDTLRPLSAKGVIQTRRGARGLGRLVDTVGHLASSPALRATRTAELVAAELDRPRRIELWPELAPDRTAASLFARVARVARPNHPLLLVGHEPSLTELVGLAVTGETVAFAHLAKGGAACFEFPSAVRPGAARLLWLLTRKQLAAARS
jgi:phosphohistidine phosphatase